MAPDIHEQAKFLKEQLEKPTEDSKKWKAMMIGLKGVGGIFLVGALMFMFKPDIAAQIATLVQFGLTAWGGIVSIYLGAQGTVDFKTTAALQEVNKTSKEDIHETVTVRTEGGAKAFEDE